MKQAQRKYWPIRFFAMTIVLMTLLIEEPETRDSVHPLSPEDLSKTHSYWRAENYLSVGQIYLCANPLLREPLTLGHVKPLVVRHWGTSPGLNFIYVHLNRVIKGRDLNMFYVPGPGHGGPALVANAYLEVSYSEIYPNISQDEAGLRKLFTQFSFPGGISSHVAPTTPGSIHEGRELGRSTARKAAQIPLIWRSALLRPRRHFPIQLGLSASHLLSRRRRCPTQRSSIKRMDPFLAAAADVWIHGAVATDFGPGLIAEDQPDLLPAIFRKLYDRK